jgi:3-deoxy-manno-octulosonate cytidylyltransferase (CMP-KDO synthetase)
VPQSAVLVVIHARIGSERLPRKPLYPLAGRPLIEWVWRRVSGFAGVDTVVVATDSEQIAAVCERAGARVELTSAEHASGTERITEVAARPAYRRYDVIVNVQGDEPFVSESHIDASVRLVREGWPIGTVAAPIRTLESWRDPAVVKVVRRSDGGALYFSRAPIPHLRAGDPSPEALSSSGYLRHVGVYAYAADVLARWAGLPRSGLEEIERLEQLRALEAGLGIGVALVDDAASGIDTPEDVRRAEQRIAAEGFKEEAVEGVERSESAPENVHGSM